MKFSDLTLTNPYFTLGPSFYEIVEPTPLHKPFLISTSQSAAALLGVDENLNLDEKLVDILNGTQKLHASQPFCMSYSGHQFGEFTGKLGDGRVINLGKVQEQNLQLKGAGLTPYSRLGDGRTVLRSSIREYLMSESIHGLGIETTRALALIGSHTKVQREVWESASMILRLSPTWVRFGTFEHFYAVGDYKKLEALAEYVIDESFAYLREDETNDKKTLYLALYSEVVKNTANTIAKWQSVGFNHGVINTDNMCIDGRTIDYGPFAFLNTYEPNYVCNKTDKQGLYSFRAQPTAARWNLEMLAKVLSPLAEHEDLEDALGTLFWSTYTKTYTNLMYQKIGVYLPKSKDKTLLEEMLRALASSQCDYTLFFRKLSTFKGDKSNILKACLKTEPLDAWLDRYTSTLKQESLPTKERHQKMLACNPKYVLKNHILQEAIEKAEVHDFSMIDDLLTVALNPYDEHLNLEYLGKLSPTQKRNLPLSCSS